MGWPRLQGRGRAGSQGRDGCGRQWAALQAAAAAAAAACRQAASRPPLTQFGIGGLAGISANAPFKQTDEGRQPKPQPTADCPIARRHTRDALCTALWEACRTAAPTWLLPNAASSGKQRLRLVNCLQLLPMRITGDDHCIWMLPFALEVRPCCVVACSRHWPAGPRLGHVQSLVANRVIHKRPGKGVCRLGCAGPLSPLSLRQPGALQAGSVEHADLWQ